MNSRWRSSAAAARKCEWWTSPPPSPYRKPANHASGCSPRVAVPRTPTFDSSSDADATRPVSSRNVGEGSAGLITSIGEQMSWGHPHSRESNSNGRIQVRALGWQPHGLHACSPEDVCELSREQRVATVNQTTLAEDISGPYLAHRPSHFATNVLRNPTIFARPSFGTLGGTGGECVAA